MNKIPTPQEIGEVYNSLMVLSHRYDKLYGAPCPTVRAVLKYWVESERHLENVRRYNLGLANEIHKLRTQLNGLGEKLINEIIKQGMFAINYPDPDVEHVFLWSGNAAEQLECVVRDFLDPPPIIIPKEK